MSFERDVNVAVKLMFTHAKSVISKNLTNAIAKGEITIDRSKLPGLDLIIERSLDDAFVQSGKSLAEILKRMHDK